MIDPDLRCKVSLITRGNHGIGAATAKMFASEGAQVAITYLDGVPSMMADAPETRTEFFNPGKPWADSVAMEIENAKGKAIGIPSDLSDIGLRQRSVVWTSWSIMPPTARFLTISTQLRSAA